MGQYPSKLALKADLQCWAKRLTAFWQNKKELARPTGKRAGKGEEEGAGKGEEEGAGKGEEEGAGKGEEDQGKAAEAAVRAEQQRTTDSRKKLVTATT